MRLLWPKPSARVAAVGVALPGFLDATRSTVIHLSNLSSLDGVKLRRRLEQRIGVPVILDTDSNAGAVAEALAGAGRGFERVLYLTMGTGLGAAFVVGGAPARVSRHTVGQVAHIPVDPAGPLCRCGERGCAEAILCARGILWRARRHGLRGVRTTEELWILAKGRRSSARSEARCNSPSETRCNSRSEARSFTRSKACSDARRAAARRTWREVGTLAARLCVILGTLFSPEVIVFGGGVAGAADLFLPVVRTSLKRRLARRLRRSVEVRAAARGRLAGAIGAAILARCAT